MDRRGTGARRQNRRTIYLVACVGDKAGRAMPARALYQSTWFKKASALAERESDAWFVLSARYGLVAADSTIAPYDESLNQVPSASRRQWASRVLGLLSHIVRPHDRIVILAGKRYREFIVDQLTKTCASVEVPMAKLAIGQQLQWLDRALESRQDEWPEISRFYQIVDQLAVRTGGPFRLSECHGRLRWPARGVYFFFGNGETRGDLGDGLRVTRVGTHAVSTGSKATLWSRLAQHKGNLKTGGGNHRGSVFRLIVGQSLMARDGGFDCPDWGRGSSAAREVRDTEFELEKAVSDYIRDLPFLVLEVDDTPSPLSQRALIEQNAIALLSERARSRPATSAAASSNWLGRHCPRAAVRESGLWNSKHVDDQHDSGSLEKLADYAKGTNPVF